jgi:raffinose/stachyose/melibiose transport system permease protein
VTMATLTAGRQRPSGRRGRGKRVAKRVSLYVIAVAVAAVIVAPIVVYAGLGSFKDNEQLGRNPLGLPSPWLVSNYTDILADDTFWRQLLNSTILAVGTMVLVVAAAACAAFALARFQFRGREATFTLFAVGLMFPFPVAVLPLFVLLRTFGLLNNPLGVILPQAAFGLPITIIILRSFFAAIPKELEEAATLDGTGPFGFFWRILLPIARPALAVVSVIALVLSWNNFLLPLVVFNTPEWYTLPIGVTQFQGEYATQIGYVLAFVTLSLVPALAFYALAERQLITGLTSGAIRG